MVAKRPTIKAGRPMAGAQVVAEYFGLPLSTLYDQRHHKRGVGALAIKVGRHLRWRWEDIEAWLDEQGEAS